MAKLKCTVGTYLQEADTEDAKALQVALEGDAQLQAISTALRSFGVRIAAHTLSRHQRGICSCEALAAQPAPASASLAEALTTLAG